MYTNLRHVNCEDLFQWPRLVSGSRRNEVPKGGWSGAELWRSLPTTLCHHIERKKPTLLGRLLFVAHVCQSVSLWLNGKSRLFCNLLLPAQSRRSKPLGLACAACFEELAGVFASSGAINRINFRILSFASFSVDEYLPHS